MKPDQPVDAYALDVLRAATEDFEDLLKHKQRTCPEVCRLEGDKLPLYAIVLMLPVDDKSFTTFIGGNTPPVFTASMLELAQKKIEAGEPAVEEPVSRPLDLRKWL